MASRRRSNRASYRTYGNVAYAPAYDGSAVRVPKREELPPQPKVRPKERKRALTRTRVQVREAGEVSLFAVIGFAGIFRRVVKSQATALTMGCVLACVLRYASHVIAGATVWKGLSIPTQASLGYSFIYNATFMVPETIVLVVAALYLGSTIDFRAEMPTRMRREAAAKGTGWLAPIAGLVVTAAVIYDVAAVFSHLQDAESGEFAITQISQVNWLSVIIVTVAAAVVAAVLLAIRASMKTKAKAA